MDNQVGKAKKVEARNFEIRRSLLKFDDVMNEQRKIIYKQRMEIINDIEIENLVEDMRDGFLDDFFDEFQFNTIEFDDKQKEKISENLKINLNIDLNFEEFKKLQNIQEDDIKNQIKRLSNDNINLKKTQYGKSFYSPKKSATQIIDKSWKEHLLSLDHLRQGISLRAMVQVH